MLDLVPFSKSSNRNSVLLLVSELNIFFERIEIAFDRLNVYKLRFPVTYRNAMHGVSIGTGRESKLNVYR